MQGGSSVTVPGSWRSRARRRSVQQNRELLAQELERAAREQRKQAPSEYRAPWRRPILAMAKRLRATLVKEFEPGAYGILWRLYRCEPGGMLPEFVIASATSHVAGREVRIFKSTKSGKVANFDEWLWTEEGTVDHEAALVAAGYTPE